MAVIILSGILLVTSLIVGGIYSEGIISKYQYVGDANSSIVYDSAKCSLEDIKVENRIFFNNKEEALSKGFHDAVCNFRK